MIMSVKNRDFYQESEYSQIF